MADELTPLAALELVGYFRFVQSDTPGVVGEVIGRSVPGHAHPSDIPVYRIPGQTKETYLTGQG